MDFAYSDIPILINLLRNDCKRESSRRRNLIESESCSLACDFCGAAVYDSKERYDYFTLCHVY